MGSAASRTIAGSSPPKQPCSCYCIVVGFQPRSRGPRSQSLDSDLPASLNLREIAVTSTGGTPVPRGVTCHPWIAVAGLSEAGLDAPSGGGDPGYTCRSALISSFTFDRSASSSGSA